MSKCVVLYGFIRTIVRMKDCSPYFKNYPKEQFLIIIALISPCSILGCDEAPPYVGMKWQCLALLYNSIITIKGKKSVFKIPDIQRKPAETNHGHAQNILYPLFYGESQ